MNNQTINAFATGLQSSLFATRDTIEDAYKYAADIINTLPVDQQIAVHTAMQVMINTIAEQVKHLTMLDEEVLVNSDGEEIGG